MGRVQNGVPYLRYEQKKNAAKHLYTSTLYYSSVDSAPKLPLAFLKVAKIVRKYIRFVVVVLLLLLSFFPSFFFITHNSKTIGRIRTFYVRNECYTIEDLPFLV